MAGSEWIWVILVIVVLFGASRLPSMGRNVGLGIKEFKKGLSEATREDDKDTSAPGRLSGEERGTSA